MVPDSRSLEQQYNVITGEKIKNHHQSPVENTTYSSFLKTNNICSPATLARREFLPKEYIKQAESVCDLIYMASILMHGHSVYIHEPLIKYRRHSGNLSNSIKMNYDALFAFQYIKENLKKDSNIFFGMARQYWAISRYSFKNKLYLKSVLYSFYTAWFVMKYHFSRLFR